MLSLNKLREFLDNSLVSYEVLNHPVAFTAQQLVAVQHVRGVELAKVVVARSGSEFTMIVLPDDSITRAVSRRDRESPGRDRLAESSVVSH
jgi:hypothetical protein